MKKLIDNIKKKPKRVRDQYAFYGAAGITLLIALVWAISIPASFDSMASNGDSGNVIKTERPAFFSTILSQSKQQFATVKEAFESFDTSTTSSNTAEVSADPVNFDEADVPSGPTSLTDIIANSQNSTVTPPTPPKVGRVVLIGTTSASSSEPAMQ